MTDHGLAAKLLLLDLASTVILGSESHRTHAHYSLRLWEPLDWLLLALIIQPCMDSVREKHHAFFLCVRVSFAVEKCLLCHCLTMTASTCSTILALAIMSHNILQF